MACAGTDLRGLAKPQAGGSDFGEFGELDF